MPRKESEAVLEGNGPVPQEEEFGSGQPTLEDFCQKMFEEIDKRFDKHIRIIRKLYKEPLRSTREKVARGSGGDEKGENSRVASLEQDARQPHLAIEANGPADTKTREHTEGAVKAVQAKHGDSCTAERVQGGPKTSTCFGVMAEPPALPCRNDVLVENSAAAPKLSPTLGDALTNSR